MLAVHIVYMYDSVGLSNGHRTAYESDHISFCVYKLHSSSSGVGGGGHNDDQNPNQKALWTKRQQMPMYILEQLLIIWKPKKRTKRTLATHIFSYLQWYMLFSLFVCLAFAHEMIESDAEVCASGKRTRLSICQCAALHFCEGQRVCLALNVCVLWDWLQFGVTCSHTHTHTRTAFNMANMMSFYSKSVTGVVVLVVILVSMSFPMFLFQCYFPSIFHIHRNLPYEIVFVYIQATGKHLHVLALLVCTLHSHFVNAIQVSLVFSGHATKIQFELLLRKYIIWYELIFTSIAIIRARVLWHWHWHWRPKRHGEPA